MALSENGRHGSTIKDENCNENQAFLNMGQSSIHTYFSPMSHSRRVQGTPQFLSVKFWIQHNELQSILHLVITGS